MNHDQLLNDIDTTYAEVKTNANDRLKAIQAAYNAERDYADVKASLEAEKNKLITQGVDGKNQAERDANLKLKLQDGYDALAKAEATLKAAQLDLRLLEVESGSLSERVRLLQAAARLMGVSE